MHAVGRADGGYEVCSVGEVAGEVGSCCVEEGVAEGGGVGGLVE